MCLMHLILYCETRSICRHKIIKNYFVQKNIDDIVNDYKCDDNCDNCQDENDNKINVDILAECKFILQFTYDFKEKITITKLIKYLYGLYDHDAINSKIILLPSFGVLSNTKQNIIYITILKLIDLNYLNYEVIEEERENDNIRDMLLVTYTNEGLIFLRNINANVNNLICII